MDEKKFTEEYILQELEKAHFHTGPLYQRMQRYKAIKHFLVNELAAIYFLSESQVPTLHTKAVIRYEKCLQTQNEPKTVMAKENINSKCSKSTLDENISEMIKHFEEMPLEWTVVQLTSQYNAHDEVNIDNARFDTNPLHISVFNCGKDQPKPFCVTVDIPRDSVNGNKVELTKEMNSIIADNKSGLVMGKRTYFKNQSEKYTYYNKRQMIESRLMNIVRDIQNLWLREWRCLLLPKFVDSQLESAIRLEITQYLKNEFPETVIDERTLEILYYLTKGCLFLTVKEMKRALDYCFPQNSNNIVKGLCNQIRSLSEKHHDTKRHPVILIIDDCLDCFPWEMIDVLKEEAVTRMPSIKFLYGLFQEHKDDIKEGRKIVTHYDKGSYIVNPDMDLKAMETRIISFFNYWTPDWTGVAGYRPQRDEFYELISSSTIFSYNGHGSGAHLLSSSERVERTSLDAIVLLFGCCSSKLNRLSPQAESYGQVQMYLLCRCPCVIGMLWEVTDQDTDILTTEFLSNWLPSKAEFHWKHVDKNKWRKNGEVDVIPPKLQLEKSYEPELLKALSISKKALKYFGTKAACVARGLPVRIEDS